MCRNKRNTITLLLAKEVNCNNTVAKHNEVYPCGASLFVCDPASASSLITSAFPLTIPPLPVLIKGRSILYASSAIFAQIFYVPLFFSFLAESNLTFSKCRTIHVCIQ